MWGDDNYPSQTLYDMYHTVQVKLKLNIKTDADILDWVREKRKDSNSTIQGSIKALIRADIAREKEQLK